MQIELQCILCKHLQKDLKCKAFPKGIPEKIITGEHDHTEPFKGDGGIRFEPIKALKNRKVENDRRKQRPAGRRGGN